MRGSGVSPDLVVEGFSQLCARASTHFLLLVRGVMLKGSALSELWPHVWPIAAFMFAVIAIGLRFYRRTLD